MKSNEAILILRQNIINFYKKYESIILPALRFIIILVALYFIKDKTQYRGVLGKTIIMMGIAALGSFVSIQTLNIMAIILITIFTSSYHMIFGISLCIIMCALYLLYIRLFPRQGLVILATLVAFYIKAELLVAIICGLFGTYICILSIIIATAIWFYLPIIQQILSSIGLDKEMLADSIEKILNTDMQPIFINPNFMIAVIIMGISFTVVYIIRRQSIDYGPYIAIVVGGIMDIIGYGLAVIFVEYFDINFAMVVLKVIVFSLIASIVQFFSIVLDYQRSENLCFEDEDNFYYVKVVPKIHILPKKKVIKRVYTNPTEDENKCLNEEK